MAYTNIKLHYSDTLLALSQEKPLSKITVLDIITRAQTSKQTFYNNFRDKYDLINYFFEHNAASISRKQMVDGNWIKSKKEILDFIQAHKHYFMSAVALEDVNSFSNYYIQYLKDFNLAYIANNYGQVDLSDDLLFAINYHCWGCTGIIINWIKNGMTESTDFVARSIFNCVPGELKQYFHNWS